MKELHGAMRGSCDTFVVMGNCTSHGGVVFGKNSDRPRDEVQEIVYVPGQDHQESTVQCTYIEIEQAKWTHGVILSKPAWMWGAEMGANDKNVCIGNEAVWTKAMDSHEDSKEKLLGMDLVRLGLERGGTAKEALDVIVGLLEKYGQGGPCSDSDPDFTYHNSFLIADPKEAWVLETAGPLWAALKITGGVYNISNQLSIRTEITLSSPHLQEIAKEKGWWNGNGEFNFAEALDSGGGAACIRETSGRRLLTTLSKDRAFEVDHMMEVLRNTESGIARDSSHSHPTASSQVSELRGEGMKGPSCHWFTGTPDPIRSVFKPFVFVPDVCISTHLQSPVFPPHEDPAKMKPRFRKEVDRRHHLYRLHEKAWMGNNKDHLSTLKDLESKCIAEMKAFLADYSPERDAELKDLLVDVVLSEMKFYPTQSHI